MRSLPTWSSHHLFSRKTLSLHERQGPWWIDFNGHADPIFPENPQLIPTPWTKDTRNLTTKPTNVTKPIHVSQKRSTKCNPVDVSTEKWTPGRISSTCWRPSTTNDRELNNKGMFSIVYPRTSIVLLSGRISNMMKVISLGRTGTE